MYTTSRQAKCIDPRQGGFKKVLCVCYGNQLRSPTAAFVLSDEPFHFNTRSCGLDPESAVCLIDNVMVEWADEIVVMEEAHREIVALMFPCNKPIKVLGIPDEYTYRSPELMALVEQRYIAAAMEADDGSVA